MGQNVENGKTVVQGKFEVSTKKGTREMVQPGTNVRKNHCLWKG